MQKIYFIDYYASGSKRSGNMDMALGWWMNTKEKIFWHGGNTSGFSTSLGFSKEKELVVVVLANTQNFKEREPLANAIWLEHLED